MGKIFGIFGKHKKKNAKKEMTVEERVQMKLDSCYNNGKGRMSKEHYDRINRLEKNEDLEAKLDVLMGFEKRMDALKAHVDETVEIMTEQLQGLQEAAHEVERLSEKYSENASQESSE